MSLHHRFKRAAVTSEGVGVKALGWLIACMTLLAACVAPPGAPAASASGSSFTFTGSGWGHGVGMSQWGARGMAAAGHSHTQILGHYYRGTQVTTRAEASDLRVLIAQQVPTFTLTTGGTTTVSGVGTVGAGARLTMSRSGSSVRITGALNATVNGAVTVGYAGNGDLAVSPPGYSYRYGSLRISPDPAGGLRGVIGGLSMRAYLYGLGEMPSSWPAAALRAQAVAGRTFAQKRRDLRGGADFDLYGSVLHQAYTGTRHQAPAWTAAVDATSGQVVTYGGGLIDAVYSSSSGGHTENSEVVWVAPVPYLRGVPDPHDSGGGNPHASWSRTYTGAQLGSWFGIGTVTSVRILGSTGVSGRVDKATVELVGTGGTRQVGGASFRATVNSRSPGAALMSTRFTVGGRAPAPAPAPANAMPTGHLHTATAEGRTVVIAGSARDPQGVPLVRVVSTMGRERAVRDVRPTDGEFRVSWVGAPGTRNVCVTVHDQPTGGGVSLGCRDVLVK